MRALRILYPGLQLGQVLVDNEVKEDLNEERGHWQCEVKYDECFVRCLRVRVVCVGAHKHIIDQKVQEVKPERYHMVDHELIAVDDVAAKMQLFELTSDADDRAYQNVNSQ